MLAWYKRQNLFWDVIFRFKGNYFPSVVYKDTTNEQMYKVLEIVFTVLILKLLCLLIWLVFLNNSRPLVLNVWKNIKMIKIKEC